MEEKTPLIISFCAVYILGLTSFFTHLEIVFATFILLLAILAIFFTKIKPVFALIIYSAFFLGVFNASIQVKDSDLLRSFAPSNNIKLVGVVSSIPQTNNAEKTKFYLQADSLYLNKKEIYYLKSKTLVSIKDKKENYSKIKIGDEIEIKGKLRVPFKQTNPSQFDYAKYLRNFDTFTTFYSNEWKIVNSPTLTPSKSRLSRFDNSILKANIDSVWRIFQQKLDHTRSEIINKHARVLKSPNLEILGGVVFGQEAINPPDEVKSAFISSGLIHLLAASGLNVALIFGLWSFFAYRLRFNPNFTIITGMILIAVYTCMTGFPAPVMRAAFMIELVLLGKLVDRKSDTLALMSLVALILLLYNPKLINSVSFQLSFLVTLGIVVCVEPILKKIIKEKKKEEKGNFIEKILGGAPEFICASITVPLISQIWVAPLQAYYFNTFSTYSVIANILVIPFISILSFAGFISSIFAAVFIKIPLISDNIVKIFDIAMDPLITIIYNISKYFSNLKGALVTTAQPQIWQMLIYYILVLAFVYLLKSPNFKKIKLAVLITITIIFSLTFIKINNNNLEITAFDVQNADCILIKTPKNAHIIIDSGKMPYGNFSQSKATIIEYLKDRGIKDIDLFIITHFDSDHSGGTNDILKSLKVKKVAVNSLGDNSKLSNLIFKNFKENKTNWFIVNNNETLFKEDDFKLTGLIIPQNSPLAENEHSIVSLLQYKHFKALFTGDTGYKGLERLLDNIGTVDLLKLGHHGAKTSINAPILTHLKPKYALISTGPNQYGHPSLEILELLKSQNITILRTDATGAVGFLSNGRDTKVFKFSKH